MAAAVGLGEGANAAAEGVVRHYEVVAAGVESDGMGGLGAGDEDVVADDDVAVAAAGFVGGEVEFGLTLVIAGRKVRRPRRGLCSHLVVFLLKTLPWLSRLRGWLIHEPRPPLQNVLPMSSVSSDQTICCQR